MWLFFTPIVLSSLVDWIIPQKYSRKFHLDLVIWHGIGLFYLLVKMVSPVNGLVVNALDEMGIPTVIVVDPTDLLALLSLPISYYSWRTNDNRPRHSSFSRSLLILSVMVLLTLADDDTAQNYGIRCFTRENNGIGAISYFYGGYISADGGKTWNASDDISGDCNWTSKDTYDVVGNGQLQARFESGQPIKISTDGGKSWKVEYKIKFDTAAQQAYYMKYHSGDNPIYQEGPFDAIIDPKTGNFLFAMGLDRVLLRTPNSTWQWVGVDIYNAMDYSKPNFFELLWGDGVLAIVSGLLSFTVLGRKVGIETKQQKKGYAVTVRDFFIEVVWFLLGFFIFITIFNPTLTPLDLMPISAFAFGILFLISLFLSLSVITSLPVIQKSTLKKLIIFPVAGMCLFFLSYTLWFVNLMPGYIASGLAFILLIGIINWGQRSLKTPLEESSPSIAPLRQ